MWLPCHRSAPATRMCRLACWGMGGTRSRAGTPSRLNSRLTGPRRAARGPQPTQTPVQQRVSPGGSGGQLGSPTRRRRCPHAWPAFPVLVLRGVASQLVPFSTRDAWTQRLTPHPTASGREATWRSCNRYPKGCRVPVLPLLTTRTRARDFVPACQSHSADDTC